MLVELGLARQTVEGHQNESPGIEGGQRRRDHCRGEHVKHHRIVGREGSLDDRVLGEVTGGERKSGEREGADHHHRIGKR